MISAPHRDPNRAQFSRAEKSLRVYAATDAACAAAQNSQMFCPFSSVLIGLAPLAVSPSPSPHVTAAASDHPRAPHVGTGLLSPDPQPRGPARSAVLRGGRLLGHGRRRNLKRAASCCPPPGTAALRRGNRRASQEATTERWGQARASRTSARRDHHCDGWAGQRESRSLWSRQGRQGLL